MIVNHKSWHYQVVKWTETFVDTLDSCQYIRAVILNCIFMSTIVSVGSIIAGNVVAWIACLIFVGFVQPNEVVFVVITILLACALVCFVFFAKYHIEEWSYRKKQGFVSQAYDRVKNKFCSKLEIV